MAVNRTHEETLILAQVEKIKLARKKNADATSKVDLLRQELTRAEEYRAASVIEFQNEQTKLDQLIK